MLCVERQLAKCDLIEKDDMVHDTSYFPYSSFTMLVMSEFFQSIFSEAPEIAPNPETR